MATVSTNDPLQGSWHRWFRRTNVYIGEYILMLILMGSFLGILASLWYSFFGLIATDDYSAVEMAKMTAAQLGGLLVVGPAAYWMYARVTGQEMVDPTLHQRRSRTVFLAIWMILVVLALVSIVASVVSGVASAVFGFGEEAGELWLGVVVPGLLAAATLAFGLSMVVKHASRAFVLKTASTVVAALAVVLLIGNVAMIVVRKDIKEPVQESCTFSEYLDKECTYQEYRNGIEDRDSIQPTTPGASDFNDYPSIFN